jgi:hypothetical protein
MRCVAYYRPGTRDNTGGGRFVCVGLVPWIVIFLTQKEMNVNMLFSKKSIREKYDERNSLLW